MQANKPSTSETLRLFVAPRTTQFFQPAVQELRTLRAEEEEQWHDDGTTLSAACSVPGLWEPSVIEVDENGELTVTLVAAERPTTRAAPQQSRDVASMAPELVVGCRVEARGLTGRPDLNGAFGHVREFDSKRGRFSVHLDSEEVVGLKPANLVLADDEVLPTPVDAEATAWNELRPLLRCVRRMRLPMAADFRSPELNVTHADGALRIQVPKVVWANDDVSPEKVFATDMDLGFLDDIMDIDMTGPTGVAAAGA